MIILVALGVPAKVPAAVAVPNVNKFVLVVLIIPDVIVKVPLIDKGTFNVTPVAFELLTVKEVKLAVGEVAKFLNTPDPEIV